MTHLTHAQVMILRERVPAGGITFEQEPDGTIIYSEGDDTQIAITPRGDLKRVVEINETTVALLSNDPDAVMKLDHNAATGGFHFDEPMPGCPICKEEV